MDVYVSANSEYKIKALKLNDENDHTLHEYKTDDLNHSHNRRKYRLEDNEELIGVYGVTDKEDWITSLGFLVKVK